MWYASAIDWCNEAMSKRDFVDDDGADVNPPDAVVQGVYEFVRVLKDQHERPSTIVKKTKTGAREEEYEPAGTAGIISAAAIAAWPFIEKYCTDVSLFSSGGA